MNFFFYRFEFAEMQIINPHRSDVDVSIFVVTSCHLRPCHPVSCHKPLTRSTRCFDMKFWFVCLITRYIFHQFFSQSPIWLPELLIPELLIQVFRCWFLSMVPNWLTWSSCLHGFHICQCFETVWQRCQFSTFPYPYLFPDYLIIYVSSLSGWLLN